MQKFFYDHPHRDKDILEKLFTTHTHIRFIYLFSSNFKSLATLIKSVIGTGLFAMPNAFASVGLVIGVAGTILIGLLITGCLHILLKIHRKMCIRLRRPILNYDEVVVATLTTGNKKPWLSSRIATFVNLHIHQFSHPTIKISLSLSLCTRNIQLYYRRTK